MQPGTSNDNWTPVYFLVLLIPIGFVAAAVFWCFSARRRRRLDARRNHDRDLEVAVAAPAAAATIRGTHLFSLPRAPRGGPRLPPHSHIPSRALLSNSVWEGNQGRLLVTGPQKTTLRLPNADIALPGPTLSTTKHGPRRHYNGRGIEEAEQILIQPDTAPLSSSVRSSSSPSRPPGHVVSSLRHWHACESGPRRRREHHKKVAALRSTTEVLEEASEEG
ncbi:hypothetical protein C8A03DRAFT_38389 [Achaetomium macrosporum]|uniref:Uncharacterized protein n=1 Tax=Achaetomium macrosporum TaxID=79813 RepID=A0AAN7H788_9PEZI|nr:hypothetical protein C8A03DRAFT_38389 [Achaetomium macrosporum]